MCKLKDKVQDLKGWNIKVGSQVSFFYCGCCDRNIIKTLNKVSDNYIACLKRELTKKENKLNDLDKIFERKVYNYKHSKETKHTPKQIKAYVERAESIRDKNKKKLTLDIWSIKKKLERFVPFLERKVIYVIDSILEDEPHTKVIKISGSEMSRFWTIKEYEHYLETGKFPTTFQEGKLDRLDTDVIYQQAISGKYTGKEICDLYDISKTTLTKLLKGKRTNIINRKGYAV